jgi:Na+-driven multidrug efflux pump
LRLLNAPDAVLPEAAPLLAALAPSLLLDAWNATMASVMRAHLRVRDTLKVVVSAHAVHLALALVLMPAFGLAGFAFALAASRLFGLGFNLLLWRERLNLLPRAADWWQLRRAELVAVFRIVAPGAAENVGYRLAFVVSVAVAGSLGAKALATQAYVLQINLLVLLAGLANGLAVEIVVGRLVGRGRLNEAHRLVRRALAIGLVLSVAAAATAAMAAPWLMGRFTADREIVEAALPLLWWSVVLEPGRTCNVVVINALRAAGDARFPVLAGAASMAVVLAFGSWLLGSALGLGLVGIWIAYAADEWLRGLIMWARWSRLGWVRHARAARRDGRLSQRMNE